ncbi:ubiquitin-like protein Pup [Candidatus Poribacteria bacterium]|nr:ubiquitin-like protein Pup [Candidatus Poribacteria bacterium]MXV84370.1 ubiquitin-like protein Pup [Candidatus Poribacteria bacterium]MYA57594.1 ubiquitin-like protein Pup [Candidatus Poribacteria bacterium]
MSTEKQQEQVNHPVDETEEIELNVKSSEMDEEFVEDLDSLLDEIDEILEEDSQAFVENYIQRGGQ